MSFIYLLIPLQFQHCLWCYFSSAHDCADAKALRTDVPKLQEPHDHYAQHA